MNEDGTGNMGETRNVYKIPVRKPTGNKPLGRPMHRLKDNVKMDFKAAEWEEKSCCEQANEPSGSIRGGEFPE